MSTDGEALTKLADHWERSASYIEKRNQSINRSKCHDGQRSLNTGLAAGYRAAAEQLRAALGIAPEVPAAAAQAEPGVDQTDGE